MSHRIRLFPTEKSVIDTLNKAQRAKGFDLVRTLAQINPKDLLPSPPSLTERYTGKTMGEHAEEMAQNLNDRQEVAGKLLDPFPSESRISQIRWSSRSIVHGRSAQRWQAGQR